MKTNQSLFSTIWVAVVAALALYVQTVLAADSNPPERMTYQGYLVDGDGNALGNTNTGPKNYDVIFRIWNDQSATGVGNKLWVEQQTITVDKGYFSVMLGEGSAVGSEPRPALSALFAAVDASDRFIEITVKGIGAAGADVTILPRLRLLTAPYAFLAKNAIRANSLINGTNNVMTLSGTNIAVNKLSPGYTFDVNGTIAGTTVIAVSNLIGQNLAVTGTSTHVGAAQFGTINGSTVNVSGNARANYLTVTNTASVGGRVDLRKPGNRERNSQQRRSHWRHNFVGNYRRCYGFGLRNDTPGRNYHVERHHSARRLGIVRWWHLQRQGYPQTCGAVSFWAMGRAAV